MDHVGLLLSISELNDMLNETTSLPAFLDRCIAVVAQHFGAEVCSIYLYDPIKKCLNLTSTLGLNHKNAGAVTLKLGEGLTGLALQELRPIMTAESSKHPSYRFFPGLDEEEYDAYLGIPILRGIERIGVLVIQRNSSRPFEESDQTALRGVANQVAAMIEYARLLINSGKKNAHMTKEKSTCPPFIKGRSASGGWTYGPVVIKAEIKDLNALPDSFYAGSKTLDDFNEALDATIGQLATFQAQIEERLMDVASLIFASHILLLKDDQFVGKVRRLINDGVQPVKALVMVSEQYIAIFAKQNNPYFRQKADDIRDVTFRVLNNLVRSEGGNTLIKDSIVIASDLVPSDILLLSVEKASGIILIGGGVTSHVAILARSLKLPMVIADVPALLELAEGSKALVDAETGNIFVDPEPVVTAPYEQRRKRGQKLGETDELTLHPCTADETQIAIFANVNLISDATDALAVHAKGIGLYRTEFPFMIRNAFPVEEEQYVVYRKLIESMRGLPVTFRTLDIGGDKALSYYADFVEHNPFLGMRSMRFCLENRGVFKSQIRAILRAGEMADLRIMFPMISSIDELEDAIAVVNECKKELLAERASFHSDPAIGIMIELPAALEICDELAERCDFFSIGTNDLVQYILAVDRTNEKVAKYYCPHHPSVLRAIKRVADSALKAGIDLSVCGDMAHESRYLEFLIGIGIRTISIDPLYFSPVCSFLKTMTVSHAGEKAEKMLACDSIRDVERILSRSTGIILG
jgi:phosphotransferase system enzyme I (PtsP)